MPKLTLNYCCIVDVMQVEPKPTDNQRKNRKVILHVDEEDIFDMLDSLNPKNIIKYLDMRGIAHREPANIVVKVKPDASGLKLRHNLKRVAAELRNARRARNTPPLKTVCLFDRQPNRQTVGNRIGKRFQTHILQTNLRPPTDGLNGKTKW